MKKAGQINCKWAAGKIGTSVDHQAILYPANYVIKLYHPEHWSNIDLCILRWPTTSLLRKLNTWDASATGLMGTGTRQDVFQSTRNLYSPNFSTVQTIIHQLVWVQAYLLSQSKEKKNWFKPELLLSLF